MQAVKGEEAKRGIEAMKGYEAINTHRYTLLRINID